MKRLIKNEGFTLIELLVVIAVIGLLATIVMVSLNSARGKARSTRRMADLRQIKLALEMYYDTNGSYPSTGSVWQSACSYPTTYIPGLSTYINQLPRDPLENCSVLAYWYYYRSDGTNYKALIPYRIYERCSDGQGPGIVDPARLCSNASEQSWAAYTSGAAGW